MSKQDLMFSLVQQQEQSNSTIVDFCVEHAVKLPTFHYWRRKYKLASQEMNGFISITPPKVTDPTIRLSYPNGVSIHLSRVDLPLIAQLIRLA